VKRFELIHFSSDDSLAATAAARWLKEIEVSGRGSEPHYVALSGGRIARKLFASVARQANERQLSLSAVQFFWADERCVPPTDPESNFCTARELLFAPLQVPDAQIHRIRGEESATTAATEAGADICRLAPIDRDRQPILDLVLLGMGEDGHVASLFPGEPRSAISDPEVYRPVIASKTPRRRITLGYLAIAAARQVWVLASGPGKEGALRESLGPLGQTPLARVLKSRGSTRIFTDIKVR